MVHYKGGIERHAHHNPQKRGSKAAMNVIDEVRHAIANSLHLGHVLPVNHWSGATMGWDKPLRIEGDKVVMENSDCGRGGPFTITFEDWTRRVVEYGLWRCVGIWNFVPADDPAAHDIAFCHSNPDSAGSILYERGIEIEALTRQLSEPRTPDEF